MKNLLTLSCVFVFLFSSLWLNSQTPNGYFDTNQECFKLQNAADETRYLAYGFDQWLKAAKFEDYFGKDFRWHMVVKDKGTFKYRIESWNHPGNFLRQRTATTVTCDAVSEGNAGWGGLWFIELNPPGNGNPNSYYTIKNGNGAYLGLEKNVYSGKNENIVFAAAANAPKYHWNVIPVPNPGVPDKITATGMDVTDITWKWNDLKVDFKKVGPKSWDYFRDDKWFGRLTDVGRTNDEIKLKDDDRDRQTFRVNIKDGKVWGTDHNTTNNYLVGSLKAASTSGKTYEIGDVNGLNITKVVTDNNTTYRQLNQNTWQQLFNSGGANMLTLTKREKGMIYLKHPSYNIEIDLSFRKIFYKWGDNTGIVPRNTEVIETTSKEALSDVTAQNAQMVITSSKDTLLKIGPVTWRSLRGDWLVYKQTRSDASSINIKHWKTNFEMKMDFSNYTLSKVETNGSLGSLGTIITADKKHNYIDQVDYLLASKNNAGGQTLSPIDLLNSGIPKEELYGRKDHNGHIIYRIVAPVNNKDFGKSESDKSVTLNTYTNSNTTKTLIYRVFGDTSEIILTESLDTNITWERYNNADFTHNLDLLSKNKMEIKYRDNINNSIIRINFVDLFVYEKLNNTTSEKRTGFIVEADTAYTIIESYPFILENDLQSIFKWIRNELLIQEVPYCWRDSYGRGVGEVASACAKRGWIKDEEGGPAGLCYPKCKSGYHGRHHLCWQSCPSPYTDHGAYCNKPAAQGRGWGRIPDVKCPAGFSQRGIGTAAWCDNRATWLWDLETRSATNTCKSNEEMCLALCYPKCKPGYSPAGCNLCEYSCPEPFDHDMGISCAKHTYSRGWGELSICGPGTIRDETGGPAGLCYPECKQGFHGIGPVCWQDCPEGWAECAAGCAQTKDDCAYTTIDQVMAPIMLAANIATFGMSGGATAAAKAAASSTKVASVTSKSGKVWTATTKVGKAFLWAGKKMKALGKYGASKLQSINPSTYKNGSGIAKRIYHARWGPMKGASKLETATLTLKKFMTVNKTRGNAYKAYGRFEKEFAADFENQTSTKINNKINAFYGPEKAEYIKKKYAGVEFVELDHDLEMEIAQTVLEFGSMVDITGVVGVAAAYTKPVCNDLVPWPIDKE